MCHYEAIINEIIHTGSNINLYFLKTNWMFLRENSPKFSIFRPDSLHKEKRKMKKWIALNINVLKILKRLIKKDEKWPKF